MSKIADSFVGSRFTVSTEVKLMTFEGPVLATCDAFYFGACTTGLGSVLHGAAGAAGGAGGLVGGVIGGLAAGVIDGLSPATTRANISPYWRRGANLAPEILRRMNLSQNAEVFVVPRSEIEELRYWSLWGEMKVITYTTDFRIDVNPFKLLWMRRTLRNLGWKV